MDNAGNCTLISLIGTGMYNEKDGGYRKTTYQFLNGDKITSTLFLDALLESNYSKKIKKIVIVGTVTSDWSALLAKFEKENNELEELRITIFDEIKTSKKLSEESKEKLQASLTNLYKIPCVLKFHTDCVDFNTIEEIFEVYTSINNEVKQESDILFDITHGFRSMPVLLYQNLQYNSLLFNRPVELIYGEYISTEKISYVRDLSKYWELSEITRGCSVFYTTLDGTILVSHVEKHWESGAKWLKRFTGIVNANFSLQLQECFAELKNAINKFDKDTNKMPLWIHELIRFLKDLNEQIYDEKMSCLLFNYAAFLGKKKLFTQAIIALQITVETYVLESIDQTDEPDDYDFYKKTVNEKLKKLVQDDATWKKIKKVEHLRNQIAHGGRKSQQGGFPQVNNLEKQFSVGKEAINRLISQSRQ